MHRYSKGGTTIKKHLSDKRRNPLIVIIGASGSGKSTLGNSLESLGVSPLVSVTTRAMRTGEVEGKDYYFIEKEAFKTSDMLEHTEYSGNLYGLTVGEAYKKLGEGPCYAIVDKHGAEMLNNHLPHPIINIWLRIGPILMADRMRERGDKLESIYSRVTHAVEKQEFEPPIELDHYELPASLTTENQVETIKEILKYHPEINFNISVDKNTYL